MKTVTDPQNRNCRPNQEVFADTLLELAHRDSDIIVVTSDSRGSGKLVKFGDELPDQIVEVGIAEQNLVAVAAGLAATGKRVFAVSPSCFLTARALEQIKNDVCYSNHPVTLVGISAGVSYGALGSTHHSLHDLAALRAIHNLGIVVPADAYETREAVRLTSQINAPVFMRFGKKAVPDVHSGGPLEPFVLGKGYTLREGMDVAFIATGEMVWRALEAAVLLMSCGIDARVISLPSIRPLDSELVRKAGSECRAMITVEEHSIHGGLGEACASCILTAGISTRFRILGLPDEDTVTGGQDAIFSHYGLDPRGLSKAAKILLS